VRVHHRAAADKCKPTVRILAAATTAVLPAGDDEMTSTDIQ